MGTVYYATLGGRPAAVKVLRASLCSDQLIRARFRREMEILSRLRHPHIVRYFGGGEHRGQLFYAMEVMEYGNLRQVLQRYTRLDWQEVASVGCHVAAALQHAHNHGIVHRDVKPSNLFLQADGGVKLGDFGIARDVKSADLAAHGITVGTHAYMAPEQIRGSLRLSGQADLYSLGCVLFELLTGRPPFQEPDPNRVLTMHLYSDPPRPSDLDVDCPPELEVWILQMLAKDPADRPFNARAVQGRLIRLLSGAGETDRPSVAGAVPRAAGNPGMHRLARRIADLHRPNIPWWKLVVLAAIAAGIVWLARWMG